MKNYILIICIISLLQTHYTILLNINQGRQVAVGFTFSPRRIYMVRSVRDDWLHDRLLTVRIFYSQRKQAIEDSLALSYSDIGKTETRCCLSNILYL